MPWSILSPDTNCIDNASGQLVRSLYSGARQVDAVDDLKETLLYEWEKWIL